MGKDKQILIDYEEYLELEKARLLLDRLKNRTTVRQKLNPMNDFYVIEIGLPFDTLSEIVKIELPDAEYEFEIRMWAD